MLDSAPERDRSLRQMKEYSTVVVIVLLLCFGSLADAGDDRPQQQITFLTHAPDSTDDTAIVCWRERRESPVPADLHFLKLDMHNPEYEMAVFIGKDPDGPGPAEAEIEEPEVLASRHQAIAAVNANAWIGLPDSQGKQSVVFSNKAPVEVYGLAAAAGIIRSEPELDRTGFWLDQSGNAGFGSIPTNTPIRCAVSDWRSRLLRQGAIVPMPGGDRHPRTALGLTQSGRHLILVVVDGRRKGESEGMTLHELAEALKELGCHDAINMDGGGSSIMLARHEGQLTIINRPASSGIRPIPVMIGVREKTESSK